MSPKQLERTEIRYTVPQVTSRILLQSASSFLGETHWFSQSAIHWKSVLQIRDGEYLCRQAPDICRLQCLLAETDLTFRPASHSSSLNAILNHLIQIHHSEPFYRLLTAYTIMQNRQEFDCEAPHKPAPVQSWTLWLFWDKVSCSSAWPKTHSVTEDDLKLLILLLPFPLF